MTICKFGSDYNKRRILWTHWKIYAFSLTIIVKWLKCLSSISAKNSGNEWICFIHRENSMFQNHCEWWLAHEIGPEWNLFSNLSRCMKSARLNIFYQIHRNQSVIKLMDKPNASFDSLGNIETNENRTRQFTVNIHSGEITFNCNK